MENDKVFDGITDAVILSKWKAPKSGRGFGFTVGKRFCKDICHRYSNGRPIGNAYKTHYYCSFCAVWMLHDVAIIMSKTPRCPCCKQRVKTKTSKSKYANTKK